MPERFPFPVFDLDRFTEPTWADVELRARYCPIVGAMVKAIDAGLDRETALITCVLFFSHYREEMLHSSMRDAMTDAARPRGW